MHYYKRNLGDYAKKAGRLSMLQHGSYTLLIDACYDREQFPTLEEAIEWTWASTAEEIEAVSFVLRKFFVLENGVYVQKRIQEELSEYRAKAATNKRIADERETLRKEKGTKRTRSVDDSCGAGDEAPPNHKPITINQEPIKEKKSASAPTIPELSDSLMADFLKVRKAKAAPLTETAIAGIRREADKAGLSMVEAITECVECNWQGFRADWHAERKGKAKTNGSATANTHKYAAAARTIFGPSADDLRTFDA